MADHLGEGEEGLSDGDVAPDGLRDLVGVVGLLGDQLVDLLLAAVVLGDAVIDPLSGLGLVGAAGPTRAGLGNMALGWGPRRPGTIAPH